MKIKNLRALALILIITIQVQASIDFNKFHLAETIQHHQIFNENSDLSVIVTGCGGKQKLQLTLKSFFYFCTYPIKKLFIAHCSKNLIQAASLLPQKYELYKNFVQIVQSLDDQNGIVNALQSIYKKIATQYVFQTDAQWVMAKGFSFVQQSINIIKQAKQNNIKIGQVVTNYPYWRAIARLSQLKWTKNGEAYHEIIPFMPQKFLYFTTAPSVFDFPSIYSTVFKNSFKDLCHESKCYKKNENEVYNYDKCCLHAIGQQLYKMGYKQIYLNDGTGEPNHEYILQ